MKRALNPLVLNPLLILAAGLAVTVCLALTACGSESGKSTAGGITGTSTEPGNGGGEIPGGADPEKVQVIDDWARALTDGDVEAAAGYFKVPSTAQNGTPELTLGSRAAIVQFNKELPCGAELTRAVNQGRFIVATFALRDRPGGDCGSGAGIEARTAFVIEDSLITEWRRTAGQGEDPTAPDASGPVI